MEAGGLTVVDWVVIAVVGLSALLALFRGFIREVLSLATWLVAAFITINFFGDVKALLANHMDSKMAIMGLSSIGLFVAVLVVCSIISAIIMRLLQVGSDIGMLDSALGMVFGVARGLFILSLAYVMYAVVMPRDEFPDMLANARTLPVIEASAGFLQALAPGYAKQLEEASKQAEQAAQQKALEEMQRMQRDGGDPANYDEKQRLDLEKLLETLQRSPPAESQDNPQEAR